jgi:hypothetical protein
LVVNDVNMNLNFGPGDYYVFTSEPMPQPWHAVSVTVLDKETGLPLEQVNIRYNSAVVRQTNTEGEADFLAMNEAYTITAEKFGWLSQSSTGSLSQNLQLSFELERDLSSVDEQAAKRGIQFYPNPAKEWIRIEKAAGSTLRLYNLQGQLLLERRAEAESVQIPIQYLSPGTYVLMQLSGRQVQTGKLVVR